MGATKVQNFIIDSTFIMTPTQIKMLLIYMVTLIVSIEYIKHTCSIVLYKL